MELNREKVNIALARKAMTVTQLAEAYKTCYKIVKNMPDLWKNRFLSLSVEI